MSTIDFEHQVLVLIDDFKNDTDNRYKNLYFLGSSKIIELL